MHMLKHTKNLRAGVAALLTVLVFIAANGVASAHYVYENGNVYWTSAEDCVSGYSEVSHGTGKGYSKSTIWVKRSGGYGACSESFPRPAGYISVRQQFTGYSAPNWAVCRDTGWLYNTTTTSQMTVTRTHSSWCGPTSYYTNSSLYELNGTWKGGWLASGNHYFSN